jgi:hypothetical protein
LEKIEWRVRWKDYLNLQKKCGGGLGIFAVVLKPMILMYHLPQCGQNETFLGLPLPRLTAPPVGTSIISVSTGLGISKVELFLFEDIGLSSTPEIAVDTLAPMLVKLRENLRRKLSFLNKLSVSCLTN